MRYHRLAHPGFAGMVLAAMAVLLPLSVVAGPPCGTFELVSTPDPGASSNALTGVAAVGDGTAWAVGSQSGNGTTGLILYFDGSQWNEVAVPAGGPYLVTQTIPNNPSLAGVTFHFQALVYRSAPLQGAFTDLESIVLN